MSGISSAGIYSSNKSIFSEIQGDSQLKTTPGETELSSRGVKRKNSESVDAARNESIVQTVVGKGQGTKDLGTAPILSSPPREPDSELLFQQTLGFFTLLQGILPKNERANEAVSQRNGQASPVGNIDFSAPNVQRQSKSADAGEQQSEGEKRHSQAGSGILDGDWNAKAQLLVEIIKHEFEARNADRAAAVGESIVSMDLTRLAAQNMVTASEKRFGQQVTSAVVNFSVTALGVMQSHSGIVSQKKGIDQNAQAAAHQARMGTMSHNGQATSLPNQTPGSMSEQAALAQPQHYHLIQANECKTEAEHLQVDGQRKVANGHATNSVSGAAGELAGGQFGVDATEADKATKMAEANARAHDSTGNMKEKSVDTLNAIIVAILGILLQTGTANADAGSAIAANMAH